MQSSPKRLMPLPLVWGGAPLLVGGGSFLFITAVAPSPADAANLSLVGEGLSSSMLTSTTD